MKKRTLWIIVAAVVVAAALFFFLRGRKTGQQLSLETAKASLISIANTVTATGTVEPVTEVEVGTQVSGIISKLYVDYNDEVKEGQVIAEMDKVTLQAELESAQSQLSSAKTEFDYRTKEYNRSKTLYEKELISDAEYDESLYQYEKARNSYKQAQASMVKVKRNLGYATITSPIDGVVISRAVEEGQTVAAGFSTPTLFTIANDLTQMQVIANVDEADIGQVKEGQRVEFAVDAYPDDVFAGSVRQVRLEAKTTSNVVTYEVVIDAPNPELKLKPGLTANVTVFTLEEDNVLAVPSKALKFHPDPKLLETLGFSVARDTLSSSKKVWLVNETTLVPAPVATGYSSGDKIEITEGLSVGQIVAVSLSSMTAPQASQEGNTERSPFMPGPR